MASSATWGLLFMALVWHGSTGTVIKQGNDVPCVACSQAMSTMVPCFEFLEGGGSGEPSPRCCLAGMQLSAMCSSAETRKAVCYCFRDAKFQPPILAQRVEQLRQACVKDLPPIPADPSQDCSY
ncbi:non-specific lipid-transfer protein 8-like [Prosopis cineraria]|uniref:non-specific lipid-transfer protein 8-like n=1 Tax=Prosopis cineraria TaxID=364024 RepID=UPI00240FDE02|nr:non-specific lipid-transfer protein 8-like [Prosopis cineraria]XP_054792865.1 non-specific lipid-transfer protein 8-like [Prosopis cineraria]XP_054794089.1 non-specific lipid-transfer protein 8-like [Prosopis cineraria]